MMDGIVMNVDDQIFEIIFILNQLSLHLAGFGSVQRNRHLRQYPIECTENPNGFAAQILQMLQMKGGFRQPEANN